MSHRPIVILAAVTAALCAHTADAPAEPVLLELGASLERQFSGMEPHDYQLRLQAGEYAKLLLEQRGIKVAVQCSGPDGKVLFSGESYPKDEPEVLEWIADNAGPYRIRLTAPGSQALAGSYILTLRNMGAPTDLDHTRVAAARAYGKGLAAYKPLVREALMKTIESFQEAAENWRAAHDPSGEVTVLADMGMVYVQLGDERKALDSANQALVVARAAHLRGMEGSALTTLGVIHNNFGDRNKAIEYFDRALPLTRESGDRFGEVNVLNYLGKAYFRSGRNRRAVDYLKEALAAARAIPVRRVEGYVLGDLGQAYTNLGEYRQSLESLQQELAIERELHNRGGEAVALNNMGFAYRGLGEYQKALDVFTTASELQRQLDPKGDRLAVTLYNIAGLYHNLGDRQRALQVYQESEALLRAAGNRTSLANVLNGMGGLYGELGDTPKALELHNEALALRRASSDADGEAASLASLANDYGKLGQWEKARENYEQAVGILRASGNTSLLASTLRSLGNHYRKAGDHGRGRECLEEALGISRTIRERAGEADALAGLARLESEHGDLLKAQARADGALSAYESLRREIISPNLRASFFAGVRDVQELAVELLMRIDRQRPGAGLDAQALLASERGRARSLLELLGESGSEIRRGVDEGLLNRERELEQLISAKAELQVRLLGRKHTDAEATAAAKELDGLAADLDQVQSRIRETSPHYAALTQPAVLNLKEIQTKVLDPKTVLLEYALGKEKSFLWVVTTSSIASFDLPSKSEIESAVRPVYDFLTARNQKPVRETPAERATRVRKADEEFPAAAAKASRLLLGAAASLIENKRLLIVAEGVLQYLPFAVLPEPRPDGVGAGDPLMVNHEIVTAPSASVVSVLRQETADRRPAPKALAILADPVFSKGDVRTRPITTIQTISTATETTRSAADNQDFLRLRFSRAEAEEIARLAPPAATLKALDFDASRKTVLQPEMGQYRIVHFATHSLLDNQHPELSGIVLSRVDRDGRAQNGFLRLYDVYNLRLAADLVVLSACKTAFGGEVAGEGLVGLTRGFLYAGAARVVSTLWDIDDRATVELMKEFYSGMLVRGKRPAAAMRSAQIAMWQSHGWNTPYYWAAFTVQGEWR